MGQFLMPSLGADMEDATLVEWQKKIGDTVRRGDVIAVVETEKGAIEVESFEDGFIQRYLVKLGDTVPVGTALAEIHSDSQSEAEQAAPLTTLRLRITPAAKRLASESGIDPAAVAGSGAGGEIYRDDILAHLAKLDGGRHKLATVAEPRKQVRVGTKRAIEGAPSMRSAIAAAMARSKHEIPHYYLQDSIDLTDAWAWLSARNANLAPADRLLTGVLYLKAVALAAAKYPEFNGHFVNGAFVASQSVHVGMAIRIRDGGLVAPAIHNTTQLDPDTLMRRTRDLTDRVRAGRFRASELADPTITVSSLGERGVESLFGIIYPPQVAIVGFGKPALRPWVIDGQLAVRMLLNTTLAADHRVSDGYRGALFLQTIKDYLQAPNSIMESPQS